ncbi:MAG: hypothetical protein JWQ40_2556 [Segetibacter sp.]|nr:hypothetical protein [Segetibacter sp.]
MFTVIAIIALNNSVKRDARIVSIGILLYRLLLIPEIFLGQATEILLSTVASHTCTAHQNRQGLFPGL